MQAVARVEALHLRVCGPEHDLQPRQVKLAQPAAVVEVERRVVAAVHPVLLAHRVAVHPPLCGCCCAATSGGLLYRRVGAPDGKVSPLRHGDGVLLAPFELKRPKLRQQRL
jgi:hypothetical protein